MRGSRGGSPEGRCHSWLNSGSDIWHLDRHAGGPWEPYTDLVHGRWTRARVTARSPTPAFPRPPTCPVAGFTGSLTAAGTALRTASTNADNRSWSAFPAGDNSLATALRWPRRLVGQGRLPSGRGNPDGHRSPLTGEGRHDASRPAARSGIRALGLAAGGRLPGADPALFFPRTASAGRTGPPARRRRRRSAGAARSGGECAAHALAAGETSGVWGGLAESDRDGSAASGPLSRPGRGHHGRLTRSTVYAQGEGRRRNWRQAPACRRPNRPEQRDGSQVDRRR